MTVATPAAPETLAPESPLAPTPPTPTGLPDLRNPGSLLAQDPATEPAIEAPTEPTEPEVPEGDAATEEPAPEPAPDPKLTVELPVPGRDHKLAVSFATQEAADTARHLLKQHERLTTEVQSGQQDRATVDFLEQHPTEGLFWMAQQNPESANAFLETWVRANPERAISAVQALGFNVVADQATQRAIAAESRVAQMEMEAKVREGQSKFSQNLSTQQFRAQAQDAITTLADTLGLESGSEDFEIFADRATRRIADLWKQNHGRVTGADISTALQPLAQKFMGAPTPHHSSTQPRNDAGQFTDKAASPALVKRNDTLRKIAGPAAPTAPVPAAVTKLDPNTSLYDLRKQQRGY